MRAILSVAREDGTFPEVGTTGRTVTHETTKLGVARMARNIAKRIGRRVRVEAFTGQSIYGVPIAVWIVRQEAK